MLSLRIRATDWILSQLQRRIDKSTSRAHFNIHQEPPHCHEYGEFTGRQNVRANWKQTERKPKLSRNVQKKKK